MVRIDATADASLAAMRARSKFGIAIAAMIRMIATTISNSIKEKPSRRARGYPPVFFSVYEFLPSKEKVKLR
jgi:hypothetical protein